MMYPYPNPISGGWSQLPVDLGGNVNDYIIQKMGIFTT